jgi:phage tail-like protein
MAAGSRPFDHHGAFNFRVEIEGVQAGAFRACSGLKIETEIFEYAEGGDNGQTRKLIGHTKVGNITLRKGFVNSPALWKWRDEITKAAGAVKRRDMSIVICDDAGAEISRWNCFRVWPVRYEGPEFDGASSNASVEVLEIAPERIEKA